MGIIGAILAISSIYSPTCENAINPAFLNLQSVVFDRVF
jgi:hypothetical protein